MSPPRSVLLIQLRRFGDVVLSTALAADLKRAFPAARIDFMVGRAAEPLLRHNPNIDDVVIFDTRQLMRGVRDVRGRRYDWIVDVQVHPKTAMLTRLSGAPVRVGWDARFWGAAYTHRAVREAAPMYTVRNRQRLLELVGITPGPAEARLYLTPEERARGGQIALELGLDPNRPVVGLAIATHDPERNWRTDGFAAVADMLEAGGVQPLVFRFPGDAAIIEEYRNLTAAGTLAAWEGDRKFLALLERCDVLVSPNTGPSHMATAIGVPRVTLYGSTSPVTWSPGLPTTIALTNPRRPCLGCRRKVCPVDRECIRGIEPAEVVEAAQALLTRSMVLQSRRAEGK